MKTITATLPAFITNEWTTLDALLKHEPQHIANALVYYDRPLEGWTQVGTAEITVTFMPDAEVTKAQIEMLRQAKQKIQAEAQLKANAIEEQISKLLCLEHKQ